MASAPYDAVAAARRVPRFCTAPVLAAYRYAHSESVTNVGGYDNPQYDDHATAATLATTPAEAAGHLNQAYQILAPDAYLLPLYEVPVYLFVTDEYVNVRDNPYSPLRALYNVAQWGLAAD